MVIVGRNSNCVVATIFFAGVSHDEELGF